MNPTDLDALGTFVRRWDIGEISDLSESPGVNVADEETRKVLAAREPDSNEIIGDKTD